MPPPPIGPDDKTPVPGEELVPANDPRLSIDVARPTVDPAADSATVRALLNVQTHKPIGANWGVGELEGTGPVPAPEIKSGGQKLVVAVEKATGQRVPFLLDLNSDGVPDVRQGWFWRTVVKGAAYVVAYSAPAPWSVLARIYLDHIAPELDK